MEVLLACHNKLVSLPEEISELRRIMELDVSCNEISHLPPQIGYITSLRSLNLSRNLLVELPLELTMLRLTVLDISCNRIGSLPTRLRFMDSLMKLSLENNPLSSPPAYVCTRGRVHVFKYLDNQALKEDQKKNILGFEPCYRRSFNRPTKPSVLKVVDDSQKRHTFDSGYSTSDGDKCSTKERQECSGDLKTTIKHSNAAYGSPRTNSSNLRNDYVQDKGTIATVAEEHDKSPVPIFEKQQIKEETPTCPSEASPVCEFSKMSLEGAASGISNLSPEKQNPYGHSQTYREFKETLRIQRNTETNDAYRSTRHSDTSRPTLGLQFEESSSFSKNHVSPEETGINIANNIEKVQSSEAQQQLEDERRKQKLIQKEAVLSYVKSRTSPLKSTSSESDRCSSSTASTPCASPLPPPLVTPSNSSIGSVSPVRLEKDKVLSKPVNGVHFKLNGSTNYQEKLHQEKEQMDLLRKAIETRLRVSLPEDLGSALMDGVVLCHLANHVRPRSVASIHVPSSAVPKLTMAKCRRNIENFLEACQRIGVPKIILCSAQDILEEKNLSRLATTVQNLLTFYIGKQYDM